MKIPKLPGASLSLATALVYAAGFVISNTHLSAFAPVEFDLVRGRYLAAGLVYAMVVMPAISVTFLAAWGVHRIRTDVRYTSRKRKVLMAVHLLASVAAIAHVPATTLGMVAVDDTWSVLELAIVLVGPCLVLPTIGLAWLVERKVSQTARTPPNAYYYLAVGVMLFALTQSASYFGQSLYARVSPSFGGGASWVADVAFSPPLVVSGDTITVRRAAIFDVTENYVSLLICHGAFLDDSPPVTVARSRVELVIMRWNDAVPIDRDTYDLHFCP